ncbi:hypothetical protein AAFF_G00104770 [Aldrovandia affinis]|uniref:Uncharacterized protein n=1 Tax=Aldrovandia affinis TaxID=143900 RepID=A0AAD7T1W3_9TELE|nr:hypothetical protein AAFF_G00104770 [Aldrovandia affinis]
MCARRAWLNPPDSSAAGQAGSAPLALIDAGFATPSRQLQISNRERECVIVATLCLLASYAKGPKGGEQC